MRSPVKDPPSAVARMSRGTAVATRLLMDGNATPSPSPTIERAKSTAGRVRPAACGRARDGGCVGYEVRVA